MGYCGFFVMVCLMLVGVYFGVDVGFGVEVGFVVFVFDVFDVVVVFVVWFLVVFLVSSDFDFWIGLFLSLLSVCCIMKLLVLLNLIGL